jgi:hypothetical protein
MKQQKNVVFYISKDCHSSTRFINTASLYPSLAKIPRVDVEQLEAQQQDLIKYVPTVYDTGQFFSGTKAFEWLSQFNSEKILGEASRESEGVLYQSL